jgi:hypothetical protein
VTDSLAQSLVEAAAVLRESEVIGIERNNPPDTRVRELWPLPAEPLAVLLLAFVPLAKRVEQHGRAWIDAKALDAAVTLATAVVQASREELPAALGESPCP